MVIAALVTCYCTDVEPPYRGVGCIHSAVPSGFREAVGANLAVRNCFWQCLVVREK